MLPSNTHSDQRGKDLLMSRILIVTVALLSVASLAACGTIGKGKGKAPPPVAEEPAPVYK
jgi:hypothetical protein